MNRATKITICIALLALIGIAQIRDARSERMEFPPPITASDVARNNCIHRITDRRI